MQLLECWKKSGDFFAKKNSEMFLLVTLKALKALFLHLIIYWAVPFIVLYSVHDALCPFKASAWILRIAFLLILYLATRSSVARKTYSYYFNFWPHLLLLIPFMACVCFLLIYTGYWFWPFINVIVGFCILFYLDSRAGVNNFVQSFVRSIKMFIFNAPVIITFMGVMFIVWLAYFWKIKLLVLFVSPKSCIDLHSAADILILLLPVECVIITNLYIKWMHEQFDSYFSQPKTLE